jgi:hypothetical protein
MIQPGKASGLLATTAWQSIRASGNNSQAFFSASGLLAMAAWHSIRAVGKSSLAQHQGCWK